jgi:hypothetical protein
MSALNSKLYAILPANVAKSVRQLRDAGGMLVVNGMIGDVRVIATSAETAPGVPIDYAVLLDASAVAADSDLVTTDVVRNATLRMDDNPTAGSYQIVSLWQNNLQAMQAERYFGAAVLRSDGIAVISGMATT